MTLSTLGYTADDRGLVSDAVYRVEQESVMQEPRGPLESAVFERGRVLNRWSVRTGIPAVSTSAILGTMVLAVVVSALVAWGGGPDSIAGVETNVVYSVQRVLDGQVLYTDPSVPPHEVVQYGPLYYRLLIPLAASLDIHPAEWDSLFKAGRLLSLSLGLIGCVGVVLGCRFSLGMSWVTSACVASVAYCVCSPWLLLIRPDTILWGATLGSMFVVLGKPRSPGVFRISAALLLGVVAGVAKQNGLQALGFVVATYVFLGERRSLLMSLVGFVFALCVALAVYAAQGPYVWANVIGGVRNGVSLPDAVEFVYIPLMLTFGLAIGVLVLATLCVVSGDGDDKLRVLMTWGWGLFGINAVLALKDGSAVNYWHEFFGVMAVTCGYMMCTRVRLRSPAGRSLSRSRVMVSILIASLLPATVVNTLVREWMSRTGGGLAERDPGIPTRLEIAEDIRGRLNDGDWVLCFYESMTHPLYDRAIVPGIGIGRVSHMAGSTLYEPFVELVGSGRVPVIIDQGPLAESYLGADLSAYKLVESRDGFWIYEWSPEEVDVPSDR